MRGAGSRGLPGTQQLVGAARCGSQTACQPRSFLSNAQEASLWVEVVEIVAWQADRLRTTFEKHSPPPPAPPPPFRPRSVHS